MIGLFNVTGPPEAIARRSVIGMTDLPKKKRSKQQRSGGGAPAQQGPALSPEEQAARREQQKREWAAQKRAQERARRSAAPMVWAGVAVGSLVAMIALGFLLSRGRRRRLYRARRPPPPATRASVLAPVAKTVTIDADDQGQATNPTFSVTTITGNAGDIIEIDVNNIGSVAHNLNFAGLDGEYGCPGRLDHEPAVDSARRIGEGAGEVRSAGHIPVPLRLSPRAAEGQPDHQLTRQRETNRRR